MKKFNASLPFDLELEKNVLQHLFRRPAQWHDVSGIINPQAFTDLFHRDIYEAFTHFMQNGSAPDSRVIRDRLIKKPIWAEKGNDAILSEVSQVITGFPVGKFSSNCQALMDCYFRRSIMTICDKYFHGAAVNKNGYDILHNLENEIHALEMGLSFPSEVESWNEGERLIKSLEAIQQAKEASKNGMAGKTTGSKALDDEIGSMQDGDLIIVGAETNVGKTPFMVQIAECVAEQTGDPAAYFTLEVENIRILYKMLARASGVHTKEMITGNIQESGWAVLTGWGMTKYLKKKLIVEDTPGLDIEEIKSRARRLKAKYKKLSCIVIDYLQLVTCKAKRGIREQEVAYIAQELKNLAKELKCPVIAGSQFSRGVAANSNHIPQLHHLRESGNIEQAADTIIFLYRPELYGITDIVLPGKNFPSAGITLVIIAKHRLGFAKKGIENAIPMMYHVPEKYVDYGTTDVYYNSPHND